MNSCEQVKQNRSQYSRLDWPTLSTTDANAWFEAGMSKRMTAKENTARNWSALDREIFSRWMPPLVCDSVTSFHVIHSPCYTFIVRVCSIFCVTPFFLIWDILSLCLSRQKSKFPADRRTDGPAKKPRDRRANITVFTLTCRAWA